MIFVDMKIFVYVQNFVYLINVVMIFPTIPSLPPYTQGQSFYNIKRSTLYLLTRVRHHRLYFYLHSRQMLQLFNLTITTSITNRWQFLLRRPQRCQQSYSIFIGVSYYVMILTHLIDVLFLRIYGISRHRVQVS